MSEFLKGLFIIAGIGLLFSSIGNSLWLACAGLAMIAVAYVLPDWFIRKADPKVQQETLKAKKKRQPSREQIGFHYFKTTFLFAGHIAHLDGAICNREKQLLDSYFSRLQMDRCQVDAAIDYFNQGQQPDFDRVQAIDDFLHYCGNVPELCAHFVEMQFSFVDADSNVTLKEWKTLNYISQRLNVQKEYAHLCNEYRQRAFLYEETQAQSRTEERKRERDKRRFEREKRNQEKANKNLSTKARQLQLAFSLLGISPTKDPATIKSAYRKQIKRHHPDYLMSLGHPKDLLAESTQRSIEINKAYDMLKKHFL